MNKPVHLGLLILELSEILICEFWYDYVKPKYGEKVKLCYVDANNFIVYIKVDDIYKDIAENVKSRCDTSNWELDIMLPKGKNKKVIGLMKDNAGGKMMTKFFGLRAKTYSYLIYDDSKDKKSKRHKNMCNKKKLKCENYKNCLETTQIEKKKNI